MDKNKIITQVDAEYKPLFRRIIKNELIGHSYLPIEWEDVYYEFLFDIPELTEKFDETRGVKISAYYSSKLRYKTKNTCRHFAGGKYKYLNEAGLVDWDSSMALSDSMHVDTSPFDITVLSNLELMIYKRHVLEYMNLWDISVKEKISYRKIRGSFKALKQKMLNQI